MFWQFLTLLLVIDEVGLMPELLEPDIDSEGCYAKSDFFINHAFTNDSDIYVIFRDDFLLEDDVLYLRMFW